MLEDFELKKNMSKKFFNGSKWVSKKSGEFEIIGNLNKPIYDKKGVPSYPYYLCRFNDGTIVISNRNVIKSGGTHNPNTPTVCGVGYLGIGKWKATQNGENTKEYTLWSGMLYRCYCNSKYRYNFKTYEKCTVDSSWHNFQTFCEDITSLTNYQHWKNEENWQLDKDSIVHGNTIYSKKTCMFLPLIDNVKEMNDRTRKNRLTGLTYVAYSPDGLRIEFKNQTQFAKENNLEGSSIWKCLNGSLNTHKGWRFKIKNKGE